MQINEDELLRIAASVEGSTRHPLADAVLAAARERSPAALPAATESTTEPGQGVRATVGGKVVAVGKLDWVQNQAGSSHSQPLSDAQQWQVSCRRCTCPPPCQQGHCKAACYAVAALQFLQVQAFHSHNGLCSIKACVLGKLDWIQRHSGCSPNHSLSDACLMQWQAGL